MDAFHLGPRDTWSQIFTGGNTNDWQPCVLPRGCSAVSILAISPGGGGGGGVAGTSTNRAGGGGGSSGSVTRLLIPRMFLPDVIFMQPGQGGAGGASGTDGSAGNATYVTINPTSSLISHLLCSPPTANQGLSIGPAGSAPLAEGSSGPGKAWGTYVVIAGVAGSAGSSGSTGGTANFGTSVFLSGGAAGGGCSAANASFAGGPIANIPTGIGTNFTLTGGALGGTNPGQGGYKLMRPLILTGGSGGGGNAGATGGKGGDGAYGCGGGGGGGGVTGGAGGRGGDGLVIISCW